MAFLKLYPWERETEESKLAGAKPKVTFKTSDPVLVNSDFIVMLSDPQVEDGQPEPPPDTVVVLLHTGDSMAVKARMSDFEPPTTQEE